MPHIRKRAAIPHIQRLAKLWPIVGVVGPRQSGKTTLLNTQLGISHQVSLDDEDTLDDALHSAKVFVSRLERPTVIDEVQKAPALFDALKAAGDRKRRPGSYFLTGSTQFSARAGIRESLTGRIGLLHFYPLTLAEMHERPLITPKLNNREPSRFSIEEYSHALSRGGMPMPCFLRENSARKLYWESWLDTTIYRDMARLFKRSYDPRISLKILRRLKESANRGEYFTIDQISDIQSRKLNTYLTAFEEIFLLRRISCHDQGVGRDHWVPFDSGFLNFLLEDAHSDGNTLSLARTFFIQNLLAGLEYSGSQLQLPQYFKSARGRPIDLVWDGIPIKIITSSRLSSIGWEERALHGAMKKLGAQNGILLAPVSKLDIPKKGIGVVPWGQWL